MHDRWQEQAEHVDRNVAFLALDLLTGVLSYRVNVSPPFSALFTL